MGLSFQGLTISVGNSVLRYGQALFCFLEIQILLFSLPNKKGCEKSVGYDGGQHVMGDLRHFSGVQRNAVGA